MISGMYMGELVRLVLCHLCAEGVLFGGEGSEELLLPSRFLTKYISEIERCVCVGVRAWLEIERCVGVRAWVCVCGCAVRMGGVGRAAAAQSIPHQVHLGDREVRACAHECVRACVRACVLFAGEGSEELLLPSRFLTKYMSEIERCVGVRAWVRVRTCVCV